MPTPAEKLIGSWRLRRWILTDAAGTITQPMGPTPQGLLIYAADGWMSAMLATPGRDRFAGADPLGGTPEEAHRAMASCHAYCGRWRIEGESVVHTVELALYPNMVGTEQVRHFRFDGHHLALKTPPLTRKGASGIAELTWVRVKDKP
jgi:hypothetical protein